MIWNCQRSPAVVVVFYLGHSELRWHHATDFYEVDLACKFQRGRQVGLGFCQALKWLHEEHALKRSPIQITSLEPEMCREHRWKVEWEIFLRKLLIGMSLYAVLSVHWGNTKYNLEVFYGRCSVLTLQVRMSRHAMQGQSQLLLKHFSLRQCCADS